jgi:hypothetical protein
LESQDISPKRCYLDCLEIVDDFSWGR